MKITITSKAGDWSRWSPTQIAALKTGEHNAQVGQHIVYENKEFRVWQTHLPAGKEAPFHKHDKRYFWTALSAGHSRSYYHDGSIQEFDYEVGNTRYFPELSASNYFIHNLENIGNTMLVFTVVEFF